VASQGPNLVGAGASIAGPDTAWINPNNIVADDSALASCSPPVDTGSNNLAGTVCGFTIPTGATIDGVVVELNDLSGNTTGVFSLSLSKDGVSPIGTTKTPVAGVGWVSYGGISDLWGTTWTPTEINATTFGALLMIVLADATASSIDSMRITVYYTVGGTGGTVTWPNRSLPVLKGP
jgi:hypothetical protein